MAYSVIGHVSAGSSDGTSVTTGSLDTTGAVVLVAWLAQESDHATVTLTDSKGNTWNALTTRTEAPVQGTFYWSVPTSVGSGHTFTGTGTAGARPTLCVGAYAGGAASPFDQQNGNNSAVAGTTIATNSVTPTEASELVVAAFACRAAASFSSVDGGFTSGTAVTGDGANKETASLAYLIQTSAAAANPTFTISTSVGVKVAAIATFKVLAATNTGAMFAVF